MLSEFTFSKLNVRQQIHKTAQAVRDAERKMKSDGGPETKLEDLTS